MAGYTRQDEDNNISNGSVINADDLDAEFNALEAGFNSSTGHTHDGTEGEGAPIEKVGPAQDLVVSSSQVIPKTTNTLDLGSASVQFKDAWFDGTVDTDTLAVSGSTTMGGTLDVTGTITGNLTGDITGNVTGDLTGDVTGNVTGNVTGDLTGDITSTGTSTFTTVDVNGGVIDGTTIGGNNAAAVTGTTITATTGFVGDVTGDVTGDLTGNADTATTWETARSLTLTGDVAGTVSGVDGSGNISVSTTVQANSVALGTDTTGPYVGSLVAGTGITLTNNSGEGATPTIAIGQPVGTSDNVTFGNATVQNLTVSGTTTTVNSNDVNIADSTLTLNSDETGTPSQDAGIVIERGTEPNKSFIWDESEDKWSTGGETLVAPLEGNASTATALQTSRNIAGQSFNGTANIDIAPTDLTGITASAAAINTASSHYVPSGGIIMWSGSIADIPSGWALCDGINPNTPDLRDRFIVGAGYGYAVGAQGGAVTVTLSAAQMPQHRHYTSVSGSTNTTGAHTHTQSHDGDGTTAATATTKTAMGPNPGYYNTSSAGDHSHTVAAGGYSDYQGSSHAHENRPPYYALAYIRKT